MSLIRLRRMLSRQGKRAAIIFAALSVATVAVHHAGVHEAHGAGAAPAGMHAGHGVNGTSEGPADDVAVVAVCLAVLPMLAVLAAGVWAALRRRGWWSAAAAPSRATGAHVGRPRALLPRAGPRLLCVMRC